jgi:hypothetical protein
MLTNACRSGRMSLIARCPYSVSATTIPPRNAPSASDSPTSEVNHAVPMHNPRIANRNTSRLRLASTHDSSRGANSRDTPTSATTTTAAFKSANPTDTSSSGSGASEPNSGTISTIGTTHRSWKISVPTINRPCGAWSSCRSDSVRSTIAVLDSATANPQKIPRLLPSPAHTDTPHAASVVSPTWSAPPSAT